MTDPKELAVIYESELPALFARLKRPNTPEKRDRLRKLFLMALAKLDVLDGVEDGHTRFAAMCQQEDIWITYFVAFVCESKARRLRQAKRGKLDATD